MLKLGIIGAGRIAGAYAEVVGVCEQVELVGVADVDRRAANRLARRLGTPSYESHVDLMDSAPDAVLICTPPRDHSDIAVDMLELGVHVMCEKPLAITSDEAQRMLSTAAARETVLTMATKFRYVEAVLEGRKILTSGALGEIILVENTFASRVDMSKRWNCDPSIAGGGVLIDNGTHSVDLVRFMVGPIAEVLALEGKRSQNLAVEDTAQVFLRSEDHVRATVDLSWSIDKARDWYLEVYGSAGTIQIGWQCSRYRLGEGSDWVEFGNGYQRTQAMRDQLSNFAEAIVDGAELSITGEDALASVEVIEAAYRSMAQADWVPVASKSAYAEV